MRLASPRDQRYSIVRLRPSFQPAFLAECGDARLPERIAFGITHQHAEPPQPIWLLRVRRERHMLPTADDICGFPFASRFRATRETRVFVWQHLRLNANMLLRLNFTPCRHRFRSNTRTNLARRLAGPTFERVRERTDFPITEQPRDLRNR
jgi:hypothetical protein